MGLSYRTVEGKSAAHLHDLRLDDGALSIRLEAQKIMKKTLAFKNIVKKFPCITESSHGIEDTT